MTTAKSKGRVKSSTYTGTVDPYEEFDEESGEEEAVAAEDVPFTVTFTPRVGPPVVYRTATGQGSLDRIDAVESVVGTCSRRSMERLG